MASTTGRKLRSVSRRRRRTKRAETRSDRTALLGTVLFDQTEEAYWLVRYRGPVFFFLIVLSLAGIYTAQKVPISVFPETNFPRVVIGVDNGVMPVEQMQVTITKPIEDAVNSVPGLITVRSTTSRGSAEVSLFSTGTSICFARCSWSIRASARRGRRCPTRQSSLPTG